MTRPSSAAVEVSSAGDGAASRISPAATWGLLAAWAVHDLEEACTMGGWSARNRHELRRRLPGVPDRIWNTLDVTPAQARIAIGLMGGLVTTAAARGAATGGRSTAYQGALLGFAAHSVTHLLASCLTRGYTLGVVTSPVVVAPFGAWAIEHLHAAGVPVRWGRAAAVAATLPALAAACHALAARLAPRS